MSAAAQVESIQLVSPPPENYYQVIWPLLKEFAYQTLDSHSPTSLEETIEQAEIEREAGTLTIAVVKDGTVVGGVWVNPLGDGLCLGHLVLDRHGISAAEKMKAVREAISSIFEAGFRKIQWVFFSDNRAFRIFLKRLGAKHEGRLEAHANRDGEWVDADMMASFPRGEL